MGSGDILTVDDARDRMGSCALGEILERSRLPDGGIGSFEVVLNDEHDADLPRRGEVERLVERANVGRPIAVERQRDAVEPRPAFIDVQLLE